MKCWDHNQCLQGWNLQRHGIRQLRRPGGDQAQGRRAVPQDLRRGQRQGLTPHSLKKNSNIDQRCHQGERREKYTYPKGATAVLSEKVREIKVRQVGGVR